MSTSLEAARMAAETEVVAKAARRRFTAAEKLRVMEAVTEMAPRLGVAPTCAALGLPRATYYRSQKPRPEPKPRPAPARALPREEREQVLAVLHEPRFVDLAPAEVCATLLDEHK